MKAHQLHPALRELAAARDDGKIIVLGAGSINFRNGVDLFIMTAMWACRENQNFRFLWVGDGGKPEDMTFSSYLRDQAKRSELQKQMIFLDQLPNLEPVYALADMFLLSSRLDPMLNDTIDAAHRGIPIICFDRASGMADVLKSNPITADCVVDYLDTTMAAEVILSLSRDREALKRVAAATRQLAASDCCMPRYVEALDALGTNASGLIDDHTPEKPLLRAGKAW